MRRSFKEKGKKFLHKISGDTNSSSASNSTSAVGESSTSTLNTTECNATVSQLDFHYNENQVGGL